MQKKGPRITLTERGRWPPQGCPPSSGLDGAADITSVEAVKDPKKPSLHGKEKIPAGL
jgi:hypothetical protein